ncbi:hypothetical protein BH11PLA2_BH11PLA2_07570 [soil metagenome]
MAWSSTRISNIAACIYTATLPKYGLLFLHPHGDETLAHQSANPAWTDALTAAGIACCCPLASRTWWADRVYAPFDSTQSAEQHLIRYVVPWMQQTWKLPDRHIAVAGISMGGQAALRLAFRHPYQFPVAASVAGAIDYQIRFDDPAFPELPLVYRSKEHCRQDTATLHVPGSRPYPSVLVASDPQDHDWHPGNERLHEKMNAVGVPHEIDFETSRGGHCWDYFNVMAEPVVKFCVESLERESRRLL